MRFNEYPPHKLMVPPLLATSAEQAMNALEDVFRKMIPREMGFDAGCSRL